MLDSLQIDTTTVNAFRANADYDYSRELMHRTYSLWDLIKEELNKFLNSLFGSNLGEDSSEAFWITIAVVALVGLAIFFYMHRNAVFGNEGRKKMMKYEVTEDTIYGIDFPEAIAAAMKKADFSEAVRLTYLYTLRRLSDAKKVNWEPSKTPSQYSRELHSKDFSQMSNILLRVRYGGFPANETLCSLMQQLGDAVITEKGGAA
jgi:hypothetical protein